MPEGKPATKGVGPFPAVFETALHTVKTPFLSHTTIMVLQVKKISFILPYETNSRHAYDTAWGLIDHRDR
jgi:hypothetical protein